MKTNHTTRRVSSLLLAVFLLFSALECSALAAQDGMIRVKLTKLGTRASLSFRTNCAYAVNGSAANKIASGANCTVTLSGGSLVLTVNGGRAYSGSSLTLNRGAAGGAAGVTFTSPSLSNVYCGDLLFSLSSGGIQAVLRAYIEDYVTGVVTAEMGNSFPLEALKAQAVAARTYAMMLKKSSGSYDLVDNTNAQAFNGYRAGATNVIAAVQATKGVVAYYSGKMARMYYAASNGGQTEPAGNVWSSNLAYLAQKDDPYDYENPSSRVKKYAFQKNFASNNLPASVESAMLEGAARELAKLGLSSSASSVIIHTIESIDLHSPNYPAPSRTYKQARFTVTAGDYTGASASVSFDVPTYGLLEGALGLGINSGNNEVYEVTDSGSAFTLAARRYGHGVGMSQRGAQWMATAYGKTYREIIDFYYTGLELRQNSYSDSTGSFSGGSAGGTQEPSTGVYATIRLANAGETLNVRAGASTDADIIGKIAHGTRVEVLAQSGQWAKIRLDGNVGFVMTQYLAMEGAASPTPTPAVGGESGARDATVKLKYSTNKLHLRKGPSTSTASLGTVSDGERVTVFAVQDEWAQISARGKVGFIKVSYLVFDPVAVAPSPTAQPAQSASPSPAVPPSPTQAATQAAIVKLSSSSSTLNVRESASTSARSLGKLKNGARVDAIAISNGWAKILYGSGYGFVASRYLIPVGAPATPAPTEVPEFGAPTAPGLAPTPAPTLAPTATPVPAITPAPAEGGATRWAVVQMKSSSSRLNVRSGASGSAAVIGKLKNGTRVEVLGVSGDWAKIRLNGNTGYVSAAYLAMTASAATPAPAAAPTVAPTAVPTAAPTAVPTPAVPGEPVPTPVQTPRPEATPVPTISANPNAKALFFAMVKLSDEDGRITVREYPDADAESLGRIPNGAVVEVLDYNDSWAEIRLDGAVGYTYRKYLVKADETAVAAEDVSVYESANFGSDLLGTLKEGTRFAVKDIGGEWVRIYYRGKLGYVLIGAIEPD